MSVHDAAGDVANAVRDRIIRGELRPSTRLPCQAELAHHYAVSGRVIARAIRMLRDNGLIKTPPGKASYVSPEDDWRESTTETSMP